MVGSRNFTSIVAYSKGALKYRIKIPVSSSKQTWFTVHTQQSMGQLAQQIRQQDPDSLSVSSRNGQTTFKSALNSNQCFITINQTQYQITRSQQANSSLHGDNLTLFVDLLIASRPKKKQELKEVVNEALITIGKHTKEKLISLQQKLEDVEKYIKEIRSQKDSIARSIKMKSNLFFGFGLAGLMTHWSFFYHTIYNVEWLGWDLMEPVTYTFDQFMFILGIYYYLKIRTDLTMETLHQRHHNKHAEWMNSKRGLDLGRYRLLVKEKIRIQSDIEMLKKQLDYFE